MKTCISIFLLVLFLLNTVGYYGFFLGIQSAQEDSISQELDQDEFVGSEAMTFRIPLSVPYHIDNNEYERVQGQFEKDGEVYQLVKQKMLRDTLYIVCVKDDESKKINQELTNYVKTFSDNHDSSKHSNAKKVVTSIIEYMLMSIGVTTQQGGWVKSIEFNEFIYEESISAAIDINSPPRLFSLS
jgi:hypothetical protein